MSKYLKTHSDADKWKILQESGENINSVEMVIDVINQLHLDPSPELIREMKEIEKEYEDEIAELDPEDKYVLQAKMNKELYRAYLENNYHTRPLLFVEERAWDIGIDKQLSTILILLNDARRELKEAMVTATMDEVVDDVDGILDIIEQQWLEVKSELEDLSDYWLEFFDEKIYDALDDLKLRIKHYKEHLFGYWLQSIRIERGWSLLRTSKETGISTDALKEMEQQPTYIDERTLRILSDAYNVPFDTLWGMARNRIKDVSTFIENGVFRFGDETIQPGVRYLMAEMFRLIESDQLVDAHQTLDQIYTQYMRQANN